VWAPSFAVVAAQRYQRCAAVENGAGHSFSRSVMGFEVIAVCRDISTVDNTDRAVVQ